MTRYQFDIDDFRDRKTSLEILNSRRKKLKLSDDEVERVQQAIETYTNLIYSHDNEDYTPDYSTYGNDDYFDLTDKIYFKRYFANIYKGFEKSIIKATLSAKNAMEFGPLQEFDCYTTLPKIEMSEEELVNHARQIFQMFGDEEVNREVDVILNPDNHLLHFAEENGNDDRFAGTTHVDTFNHRTFGYIGISHTISDLFVLIHEMFHMIINRNSIPYYNTSNQIVLKEIEGYLAELFVYEYLEKNNLYVDDGTTLQVNNYVNAKYFVRNLVVTDAAIRLFDKENNFNLVRINKTLQRKGLDINIGSSDVVRDALSDFTFCLGYGFSYLVALDLYDRFKDDKKGVFDFLKEHNSIEHAIIPNLSEEGVSFYYDGFRSLRKHQAKLLQKKKEVKLN